jgi:hypothetical protein
MAVTASIIRIPYPYEPVNTNGLWTGLSSSSYALTDFKYIFNLYTYDNTAWGSATTSTTNIGNFKVSPDINNGNGYFSIHRALKSKINNRLIYGVINGSTSSLSSLFHMDNSPIKYKLDYGVEWNPYTAINAMFGYVGSGVVQLDFATTSVDIISGDIIRIQKTNPQINSQINTFATVLTAMTSSAAPATFSVTYYDGNVPSAGLYNDTGRIIYQKRMIGSITQSNNGTSGPYCDLYGIDAVRDADELYTTKILGTFKDNFILTNMKDRNIYLNQYDSVSFLSDPSVGAGNDRIDTTTIQLWNNSGTIYQIYTYSTYMTQSYAAYPQIRKWQASVGTADITYITGNDLTLASGYNVLFRSSVTGYTQSVTRTIISNCSPYDNVRLCWLNKLGGWDYFNFNMISKMNATITRQEHKKVLPYNYNVLNNQGNRQYNTIATNTEEKYTINTDWVTESEYTLLMELLESPEVYIVNGIEYTGSTSILGTAYPVPLVTPIQITTTAYQQKKIINDYNFNLTIEYKKAFDKINHNR